MDIEPLSDDGETSCYDNIINSVLIWLGRDYRLAYLDNFKFNFDVTQLVTETIWSRGKIAGYLYFDNQLKFDMYVKKYCNVKIEWFDNVDIDSLCRSIRHGHPVIVLGDTYYMWWLKDFYKRIHSSHAILLTGCDEKYFYINDTPSNYQRVVREEKVLVRELIQMIENKRGTFFWRDNIYNYQDIIKDLKDELDEEIPSKIRLFAEYIMKNEITQNEYEEFGGGGGILFRAFRNIIRCRHHYMWALQAINELNYNKELVEVINILERATEKWNLVKTMLMKDYYEGLQRKYNTCIYDTLMDISEKERKVIAALKAIEL